MNQSIAILLFSIFANMALAEAPKYESWTTFQSDYGYEVRHPSCWKPVINNPDEEGDMKQIKHLAIEEGDLCMTPRRYKSISNGVGISVLWKIVSSQAEMKMKIKENEWSLGIQLKNKDLALLKKIKINHDTALVYVEFFGDHIKKIIRWKMEIFCDTRIIAVGGPSIENPDPSYFEKFKAGEVSLPEPEKTIYESIRCINPKIKSGK